ncbi:hypothetical protein [Verrucosispora sp. TAA-831]|uniref:hypothetical protein n=1 Tax=Verrucosispora sp. TAA-831 TaxID=3422227 RepID=UPI003D6F9AFE
MMPTPLPAGVGVLDTVLLALPATAGNTYHRVLGPMAAGLDLGDEPQQVPASPMGLTACGLDLVELRPERACLASGCGCRPCVDCWPVAVPAPRLRAASPWPTLNPAGYTSRLGAAGDRVPRPPVQLRPPVPALAVTR